MPHDLLPTNTFAYMYIRIWRDDGTWEHISRAKLPNSAQQLRDLRWTFRMLNRHVRSPP